MFHHCLEVCAYLWVQLCIVVGIFTILMLDVRLIVQEAYSIATPCTGQGTLPKCDFQHFQSRPQEMHIR